MTKVEQWTVGAIFYASLVVAEALGSSGTAQVVDLFSNSANDFTPGYAIWENGTLARMVLINFMTDPSGANDYTAQISVGGVSTGEAVSTPSQVYTKYVSDNISYSEMLKHHRSLYADSVSEKYNISWAGQVRIGLGFKFHTCRSVQMRVSKASYATLQARQQISVCSVYLVAGRPRCIKRHRGLACVSEAVLDGCRSKHGPISGVLPSDAKWLHCDKV